MPAPTIAAFPPPPSRLQQPDVFVAQADAFFASFPSLRTNINALVAYLNTNAMVLGNFGNGSASSPSIRFGSDTDTGFFRLGANRIGLAEGGVSRGQVYGSGNFVGPVSQSLGIPTGAGIERGVNANGQYLRLADGTQICWGDSALNLEAPSISNVVGSEYQSSDVNWTFPAAFPPASYIVVFGQCLNPSGTLLARAMVATGVTLRGRAPISVNMPVQLRPVAIGRWY